MTDCGAIVRRVACGAVGINGLAMGKGTNGVQDGVANVQRFAAWRREVSDFKPYVYQGALSVSRIARESGLNRDVFRTNPTLRDELLPELIKELEAGGVLKPRVANPVQVVRREHRQSAVSEARVKQIQEENEALKAENSELRKRLDKLGCIEEVLLTTGRLPW